ncbi:MAG: TIGR01440 family protein [Lachnospiraceae bacterium]|nr:TIGR01440 family protein [Lachnospiraceae bacterium]
MIKESVMTIEEQATALVKEVSSLAKLKAGELLVVGCSTSAVLGERIGTHSSPELAEELWKGIYAAVKELDLHIAVQCCEHLNRALVVERETMERYGLEQVNAVPQPKAGGSLATMAYRELKDAVLVADIHAQALAGIDIGGVLIGMHVKPVVVPLKLNADTLGEARVIAARYRPRFVGGARAVYDESLE